MFDAEVFRQDPNLRSVGVGDVLFAYGDLGDEMYVVVEGQIELTSPQQGVLEVVGPGGMFGEMALVERTPRVAAATATSPGKVVPISPTRFSYLAQNTPYFALEVIRVMARRLRRMDEPASA
jgi:CRP/FNR family cyclic AMP-dependent transcriptional regulator